MALTIRQLIVDEVVIELRKIAILSGYATNVGAHVKKWWSMPLNVDQLACLIVRDLDDISAAKTNQTQRHDHSLHIQIEIMCAGTASDDDHRLILGDVEHAIRLGAEREWGGYSYLTRPRIARMIMQQESKKISGGIFECYIDYITRSFDAYA